MPTVQGDLALLNEPVAQRLLQSRIPARLAYVWGDGHTTRGAHRLSPERPRARTGHTTTPRRSKCWPTAHRWPSPSTATRCPTRYSWSRVQPTCPPWS